MSILLKNPTLTVEKKKLPVYQEYYPPTKEISKFNLDGRNREAVRPTSTKTCPTTTTSIFTPISSACIFTSADKEVSSSRLLTPLTSTQNISQSCVTCPIAKKVKRLRSTSSARTRPIGDIIANKIARLTPNDVLIDVSTDTAEIVDLTGED